MFTVGARYLYVPTGAICRVDKNDGNRQRVRITIVDPASAANGQELDELPYHLLQDIPQSSVGTPAIVAESPTAPAENPSVPAKTPRFRP